MQHLKHSHQKPNDDYIKEELKESRIGRNGQGQFWCGFCRKIIKLERRGLEAWDERFNHVDDRHFKIGQRISEWVPVDGHGPKGPQPEDTLQENIPCCNLDEDDEESCEAEPYQDPSVAGLPDEAISVPTPKSLPKRTASPISNQAPPGKKLQMDKEAFRYCVSLHCGARLDLGADIVPAI